MSGQASESPNKRQRVYRPSLQPIIYSERTRSANGISPRRPRRFRDSYERLTTTKKGAAEFATPQLSYTKSGGSESEAGVTTEPARPASSPKANFGEESCNSATPKHARKEVDSFPGTRKVEKFRVTLEEGDHHFHPDSLSFDMNLVEKGLPNLRRSPSGGGAVGSPTGSYIPFDLSSEVYPPIEPGIDTIGGDYVDDLNIAFMEIEPIAIPGHQSEPGIPETLPTTEEYGKRGAGVRWEKLVTFENEVSLEGWLESQNPKYSTLRMTDTEEGLKTYLYCEECGHPSASRRKSIMEEDIRESKPAQLCVFYPSYSPHVEVLTNSEPHRHGTRGSSGIPVEFKRVIDKQMDDYGITSVPSIIRALEQSEVAEKLDVPLPRQVESYVREKKLASRGGSVQPTMADLKVYSERFSAIPDDEDEGYVVHSAFEHDKNGRPTSFTIVFSTKNLTKEASKGWGMCVDGTYKIVWQGYPILVGTACDKNNGTWITHIAVASGESARHYTNLLLAMKTAGVAIGCSEPQIQCLIADSSSAITAACGTVFESAVRVACFFHVLKCVADALKGLNTPETIQEQLRLDLACLRLSPTRPCYLTGCDLFKLKYETAAPKEAKYITENLFPPEGRREHPKANWFVGCSVGPTTNNSLESHNRWLKTRLNRERLDVADFFTRVRLDCMPHYSRAMRQSNSSTRRKYHGLNKKVAHKRLYAASVPWAQTTKIAVVTPRTSPPRTLYFAPSRGVSDIVLTRENIEQYLSLMGGPTNNITSFDDWVRITRQLVCIYVPEEAPPLPWEKYSCTCTDFAKGGACAHVIGIALKRGHLSNDDLMQLPLSGTGRARGRSRKMGRALIRSVSDAMRSDDRILF